MSTAPGGEFDTVGGTARRGIARINASTGSLETSFDAQFSPANSDAVRCIPGFQSVGVVEPATPVGPWMPAKPGKPLGTAIPGEQGFTGIVGLTGVQGLTGVAAL